MIAPQVVIPEPTRRRTSDGGGPSPTHRGRIPAVRRLAAAASGRGAVDASVPIEGGRGMRRDGSP